MYDRSRLTRLITLALASCCVTWALAAFAQARPDTSARPVAAAAPAFQPAVGDTNKVPSATTAPAYQPAIGDSLKTPDPKQVQRVLNGIGRRPAGQPGVVNANNDDTGTIALIVAIVAMLTALAAMTMISLRTTRPVLRH
jgi:hypothetical protein